MKQLTILLSIALLQFSCEPQEEDCNCYIETYSIGIRYDRQPDGSSKKEQFKELESTEEIDCSEVDEVELGIFQELKCNEIWN